MKYHEKLNLKSPIFKYNNTATSRTPTKSPIKLAVNPTDLFQKVCCPNCKYGFKIIRQEVMKENPSQNLTPKSKKSKSRLCKQIETQTEGILTLSNNNSPGKSIVSQHKFSKTYDWSMDHQKANREYEMSRVNEILQPENNEGKALRDSEFKFKPLSLSPHSKFAKSRNLLKTLDAKRFEIQAMDHNQASRSPQRMISYQNPYYVTKQQAQIQKEENSYQNSYQNDNYRESQYKESLIQRETNGAVQHNGAGNIERNSIGYGNSNVRQNGGLISPHASSEKLEENSPKLTLPQETNNFADSPSRFSKKVGEPLSLHKQQSQLSVRNQSNQLISPQNNIQKISLQSQPQVQTQPQVQVNLPPPEPCCKCKDSLQFQDLITQIVLKNQQSENVIKELQEFCKFAGEEVEVPSFCKMLALSQ